MSASPSKSHAAPSALARSPARGAEPPDAPAADADAAAERERAALERVEAFERLLRHKTRGVGVRAHLRGLLRFGKCFAAKDLFEWAAREADLGESVARELLTQMEVRRPLVPPRPAPPAARLLHRNRFLPLHWFFRLFFSLSLSFFFFFLFFSFGFSLFLTAATARACRKRALCGA